MTGWRGDPCRLETWRLLELRERDEIRREETRRLADHLAVCFPCRDEAVIHDPTVLLLPLAASAPGGQTEKPEARTLTADVLAAVDLERARRRLLTAKRRIVLRAASVALLAVFLGVYAVKKSNPKEPGNAGTPRGKATPAAETVAAAAAGHAATALVELGSLDPWVPAPSLVEGMKRPGVKIYQFPPLSPREPTVVFVVDRNADI